MPNCTKEMKAKLTGKTKMKTLIGYKLFRQRVDGSLGSLFIDRQAKIPVGRWLRADVHPTKGYSVRHGWHALEEPNAPHLSGGAPGEGCAGRVWAMVELSGYRFFDRPSAQGGRWILASRMRVLEVLDH